MKRLLLLAVLLLAIVGTVSADTLIVYTTNATDTEFYYSVNNGTFSPMQSQAIGTVLNGVNYHRTGIFSSSSYSNTFYRLADVFDTSALPDTCTINSALLGETVAASVYALGDDGVAPVAYTYDGAFNTDDYGYTKYGTTILSPYKNLSTMTTTGIYYNWSFNSDGVAAISKTGNTPIALRIRADIGNTNAWVDFQNGSNKGSRLNTRSAENVVGTPFLEIAYTPYVEPTPAPTAAIVADWEQYFQWCGIQELFFWNGTSDVSGYKTLNHYPELADQREVNVTISSATGSQQLGAWISTVGSPGVSVIAPGFWRFRTFHNVSSQVGTTTLEFFIMNRSALGTETNLFYNKAITEDINSLDPTEYLLSYARRNATTLFKGDRLLLKVNASTSSVTSRTVYMWLAGNTNTSMVQASNFLCDAVTPTIPNFPAPIKTIYDYFNWQFLAALGALAFVIVVVIRR